jgi:hypothetical protein
MRADVEQLTPEEHARTSVFAAQLQAARRAASPPAHDETSSPADDAQHRRGRESAPSSGRSRARSVSPPPLGSAGRARSRSLPPPRGALFPDFISWWRASSTAPLNAPLPPQPRRASNSGGEEADNKLEAERIADEARFSRACAAGVRVCALTRRGAQVEAALLEAARSSGGGGDGKTPASPPPVWRDPETGALHRARAHPE